MDISARIGPKNVEKISQSRHLLPMIKDVITYQDVNKSFKPSPSYFASPIFPTVPYSRYITRLPLLPLSILLPTLQASSLLLSQLLSHLLSPPLTSPLKFSLHLLSQILPYLLPPLLFSYNENFRSQKRRK